MHCSASLIWDRLRRGGSGFSWTSIAEKTWTCNRYWSLKKMLVPGLDATREQGLRNLPKGDDYQGTDWFRCLYSVGNPYLESTLQKPNPRLASTNPIWHNPPARRNRIHYAKVTHCARILGSTQVKDQDPRQNTERWTVPEENGRLLRIRKFRKGRSSASKIECSGANVSMTCLPWTQKSWKH